jgi:hypothetical protein
MRRDVILDFVRSEISYMSHLEIIQNYYRRPLKLSGIKRYTANGRRAVLLESLHSMQPFLLFLSGAANVAIINDCLVDVLFDDVTVMYGLSR